MNAYRCMYNSPSSQQSDLINDKYRLLVSESLDFDKEDRMISPTNVTTTGSGWTHASNGQFLNKLNAFASHKPVTFYKQLRLSRFPAMVQVGRYYNVTYTGSLPAKMRYQLQGADDKESIVITVPYYRPETVRVTVNGKEVQGKTGRPGFTSDVRLQSTRGTSFWFWTENKIQFALTGSKDVILLERIDAIQLTMRLDVTTKEFWDGDGATSFIDRLAAVLLIPSYRIRVVDTVEGSTILKVHIYQDDTLSRSTTSTSTSTKTTVDELKEVQDRLVAKGQKNELNLGHDVLSINT
jgi:hypothetical protein